ncbi:MAG: DUF3089 domain-containing protein [Saprospiraceae bacterium]|nr:DUF3089 domain-containing protein [Saprospiraceae bacterium]
MHLSYCQQVVKKNYWLFEPSDIPEAPDYSQAEYWAALPTKIDSADVLLAPTLEDVQAQTEVDVFFLHPTTYNSKKKSQRTWNAPVNNDKLNEKTDGSTIKYQASIFNGVGRVFAPRYRQIHIRAFNEFETERKADAEKATLLAYSDIKAAFEYYLDHYHNGRPIIIASHSQGTVMAKLLIKDYFDGKPLQKELVAAYLVGITVPEGFFQYIPPCQTPTEIGCFTTWRTFQKDFEPKRYVADTIVVTNPLSWTTGHTLVPASYNKGTIINDKQIIYEGLIDAQVQPELGVLWITRPKQPKQLRYFPSKNFHIGDYNLFYMNVRENAAMRSSIFLKR